MARRMRAKRNVLSIAIAQTQTEQIKSPSMTPCTIQCAFQNKAQSESSEDARP
jgi:hypothetical protein